MASLTDNVARAPCSSLPTPSTGSDNGLYVNYCRYRNTDAWEILWPVGNETPAPPPAREGPRSLSGPLGGAVLTAWGPLRPVPMPRGEGRSLTGRPAQMVCG
jgi:hypothetical protein